MNTPDNPEAEIQNILQTQARSFKRQSGLMSQMAEELDNDAEEMLALLEKWKAPDANRDAVLDEAMALHGRTMEASKNRWPRFVKEFNAAPGQS